MKKLWIAAMLATLLVTGCTQESEIIEETAPAVEEVSESTETVEIEQN